MSHPKIFSSAKLWFITILTNALMCCGTPYEPAHLNALEKKTEYQSKGVWQPEWNGIVDSAIDDYGQYLTSTTLSKKIATNPDSDLAQDFAQVCPYYAKLGANKRKAFWRGIVKLISLRESGYCPDDTSNDSEMANGRKKGGFCNIGLMQLSENAFTDYKTCNSVCPQKGRTLYNPECNLTCGVAILNSVLRNTDRLFPKWGDGSQWSVMSLHLKDRTIPAAISIMKPSLPECFTERPARVARRVPRKKRSH